MSPNIRSSNHYPHRSTERANIRPGIRIVTHKNFIVYFEVDDPSSDVRILAIFLGGADHRQQIVAHLGN
jgi:plasmid stabilization system protein ParE